jgi:hypothetical protein
MAENNGSKSAWPGGTVRISMPASVANDLDAFKKGVAALAERLGCGSCFSGVDCTFQMERNFVISEELRVASTAGVIEGIQSAGATRGITVSMPSAVNYDLEKVLKVVDIIGRNLGQHWQSGGLSWCCSGFDITLQQELDFIADNDGNVRPI